MLFFRNSYSKKVQRVAKQYHLPKSKKKIFEDPRVRDFVKNKLLKLEDFIYLIDKKKSNFSTLCEEHVAALEHISHDLKRSNAELTLADFIILIDVDDGFCPLIMSADKARQVIETPIYLSRARKEEEEWMKRQIARLPHNLQAEESPIEKKHYRTPLKRS